MNGHIPGRPVSASTYSHQKCRCDGCRSAHAAYLKKMRAKEGSRTALRTKIEYRTTWRSAQRLRDAHPDEYRAIVAEVEAEMGLADLPDLRKKAS